MKAVAAAPRLPQAYALLPHTYTNPGHHVAITSTRKGSGPLGRSSSKGRTTLSGSSQFDPHTVSVQPSLKKRPPCLCCTACTVMGSSTPSQPASAGLITVCPSGQECQNLDLSDSYAPISGCLRKERSYLNTRFLFTVG